MADLRSALTYRLHLFWFTQYTALVNIVYKIICAIVQGVSTQF